MSIGCSVLVSVLALRLSVTLGGCDPTGVVESLGEDRVAVAACCFFLRSAAASFFPFCSCLYAEERRYMASHTHTHTHTHTSVSPALTKCNVYLPSKNSRNSGTNCSNSISSKALNTSVAVSVLRLAFRAKLLALKQNNERMLCRARVLKDGTNA